MYMGNDHISWNSEPIFFSHFQLMEDGQPGVAGAHAQKHVESESNIASENVTILHQNMAGGTAMDQMLDHDRAMLKLVQVKR